MNKLLTNKYLTLFSLYIAQSVPMTFFSTVLPVIMRQNHFSLTSIGLLQLIKLPWILKFIWAPTIDKSTKKINDYKHWIFSAEIIYALLIFIVAFLNLNVNFSLIVIFLLLAFTASATQDIATDAFAIIILKKDERSIGNSMQSGGSFMGTLIGSGVLLIIYAKYGWKTLIFSLAAFVIIALIPLLFYKNQNITYNKNTKKISFKDIYSFFRQKNIGKHIILLISFYTAIIGILTMSKPWLVDLGFSLSQIGLFFGVYGPISGFVTAFIAGIIIKKIGTKKSLKLFTAMSIIASGNFLILSTIQKTNTLIIAAIIILWCAYAANSVSIYTIAMNAVRKGREGTDFTIQMVLTHIGSLIIAILSGKLAHNLGYRGLFIIEIIIAIAIFFFFPLLLTFKPENYEN
jgi:MFS family permease